MLCRFFCNIGLSWFPGKKSGIIKVKDKELKIHRYWLPGRLLCSIRSNRKWCKRRGSSLECQNCFFVYPIIDSNLINLPADFLLNFCFEYNSQYTKNCRKTFSVSLLASVLGRRLIISFKNLKNSLFSALNPVITTASRFIAPIYFIEFVVYYNFVITFKRV